MSNSPDIDDLSIEELAADAAWWALYDSAFPSSEREPREAVLRSLDLGVGVALRARRRDRTIALATTHLLRRPPAVFLVYLAVDPAGRGAGVGRQMFEAAWRVSADRLRATGRHALGYVWEVDPAPDHESAAAADACCRRRRLEFFERQGGRVVSRAYRQPPVDGVTTVPMWLMYRPSPDGAAVGVEELVRAIYVEKYGQVNGIHAVT